MLLKWLVAAAVAMLIAFVAKELGYRFLSKTASTVGEVIFFGPILAVGTLFVGCLVYFCV